MYTNMKIEIKWGLIFSFVSLLWITIGYLFGFQTKYPTMHVVFSMLFAIPAILMMYLGIAEKRRVNGDKISFKQAFITGLGISIVVALLTPVVQYIFHKFINPGFFERMIEVAIAGGQSLQQAEATFNLKMYAFGGAIFGLIIGAITSLILAAILRSKEDQ